MVAVRNVAESLDGELGSGEGGGGDQKVEIVLDARGGVDAEGGFVGEAF